MKRRFSVFILLLIFISCIFTVNAETSDIAYADPITAFTVGATDGESDSVVSSEDLLSSYSADMLDRLMVRIRNAIVAHESRFSIAEYKISSAALKALCQELWNYYPEVFMQYDCIIHHTYSPSSGLACDIVLEYLIDEETFRQKKAFYFSEIKRIISTIPTGLSDLEKIVYINDYLAVNYSYDCNMGQPNEIHDAYNFLLEKRGVCQAYALTFIGIMRELGIECRFAHNNAHAWNIVKLNGQYYHIDCTHDDPITYEYGDLAGRVSHDHLLTSSAALYTRDESHSNWTASPCFYGKVSCDDTRYDGVFWNDVRTPFVYYNGYWYGISNDRNIIKANSDFTSKTSVKRLYNYWYAKDVDKYWAGFYSGLTLIGNTLYFNTPNSLVAYNIDTGILQTVKTFNSDNEIYSSYFKNGKIYCVTTYSPNTKPDSEHLVYDLKMGDIDRDGTVTATDLISVKKHLLDIGDSDNIGFADVIYDNRVDLLDLIRIKKYVSGLITEIA